MSLIARTTTSAKNLEKAINELHRNNYVGKVGWVDSDRYPTGEKVSQIAAQNEFGNPAKHIPPRPFFRPTIAKNKDFWFKYLAQGITKTVEGKSTIHEALYNVSTLAAGQVKKTISDLVNPPLSERTVRARAARLKSKVITPTLRKPLIDTKLMITTLRGTVVLSRR